MKITPSPDSVSQSLRINGRADATPSFAQLLEGGTKARSVMSYRALSFSETGILGIHFAHEAGPASVRSGLAGEDIASSGMLPVAEQGSAAEQKGRPREAAQTPNFESHCAVFGQRSANTSLPAPPVSDPEIPPAAISGRGATTGASDQAPPEVSHLASARAPAPPPMRRRSPFQVRLVGDGAELVVILEGAHCRDESILELEATARALASEYCMGISHLFVKPNGNGTTA